MRQRPSGRRPSFHHAFGLGGLSFLLSGLLALGSSIATARLYGIDVIGEFALAYAPTGAVWFLSSAREQPALIRLLAPLAPQHPRVTGLFVPVLAFSTALTLVASAIAAAGTYLLFNGPIDHPGLFAPAMVSLGAYVLFTNPAWNVDGVLSAFRAGGDLLWIRAHQMAAYLAFAVAASFFWPSVWGLIGAASASWVTSLVHRLWVLPKWMSWSVPRGEIREGFRELPDILRFGLKMTPGSLANGVSDQLGTWILGAHGSLSAVGAWNRAWGLSQRFVELNYRITEIVFPTLVERHVGEDRGGFDRALVDSQRYVAGAMLLPAAVGGGAAAAVMGLFGPGFSSAATALALVLLIPALTTILDIQASALLAVERPVATTLLAGTRLAATIPLTLVLTISMGVTGAALGVTLGYVLQLAVQSVVVRAHLTEPVLRLWPARQFAGLLAAYAAGFGAAHAVDALVPGVPGLVLALGAGSIAYPAALLVVGGLLQRDRQLIESLSAGLAPRFRWIARVLPRPQPSTLRAEP